MQAVTRFVEDTFINAGECCESFIGQSFQMCWLMAIQDPPVCLVDWKDLHGQPFNTVMYKHYTRTGGMVDYAVWPAMLLCKGGSLLSKGVAQAMEHADETAEKRNHATEHSSDVGVDVNKVTISFDTQTDESEAGPATETTVDEEK